MDPEMRGCHTESGETFASESLRRGLLIRCHAPKDSHSRISGLLLAPPRNMRIRGVQLGYRKRRCWGRLPEKGRSVCGIVLHVVRINPGLGAGRVEPRVRGPTGLLSAQMGPFLHTPSFCPRDFLCVCLYKGIVSPVPKGGKSNSKNELYGTIVQPIVASYQPLFRDRNGGAGGKPRDDDPPPKSEVNPPANSPRPQSARVFVGDPMEGCGTNYRFCNAVCSVPFRFHPLLFSSVVRRPNANIGSEGRKPPFVPTIQPRQGTP